MSGAARGGNEDRFGWRQEGRDLLRAVAAGALIGMPLLYTLEMWMRGMTLSPGRLLLLLGALLVVNFCFSLLSGFRQEYSAAEAASESVTSVGVGALLSAAVLWLIGEVTTEASWSDNLGRVLIQTAPVSLGVTFANGQFRGGQSRQGEEADAGDKDPERSQFRADLRDVGSTLAGAAVFAVSIAPTEEVAGIAGRLSPARLLVLMGASLLLCYVILFAAGFQQRRVWVPSLFQHPVSETVMTYAFSLAVAFALLWLLGRDAVTRGPEAWVAAAVTLGLLAAVGGAAGRLVA